MSNQFDIWAALPTFSLCYFTARDLTFTVPIPSHFARFVSDVNNLRILSSARTHDRMIPAHTILAQILWLSVPSIQFTAFLLLLVFTCGHHLLLPLAQSSASKVMLSSKKREWHRWSAGSTGNNLPHPLISKSEEVMPCHSTAQRWCGKTAKPLGFAGSTRSTHSLIMLPDSTGSGPRCHKVRAGRLTEATIQVFGQIVLRGNKLGR